MFDVKLFFLLGVVILIAVGFIILTLSKRKTVSLIISLCAFAGAALLGSMSLVHSLNKDYERQIEEQNPTTTATQPDINLGLLNEGRGVTLIEGNKSFSGLKGRYKFLATVEGTLYEKEIDVIGEAPFTIHYEIDVSDINKAPENIKVKIELEEIKNV